MSFLTEPEPARGELLPVAPGIARIVADNPGPMTYWGTNTYLIDTPDGLLVLDPGPDDPHHVANILTAARDRITGIVVSHSHHDHVGALPALRQQTGAPVHAWHASKVEPDIRLHDGDSIGPWQAIHTPGHASDHLCFAGPDGILFSADHVMGWSSSIVPPPDGNMADYFRSLRRLLARPEQLYLPGHGPALPTPHAFTQDLLAHRQSRENAILATLGPVPQSTNALMERLYSKVDPMLKRAAELNVVAHLQKLQAEGRALDTPEGWVPAT